MKGSKLIDVVIALGANTFISMLWAYEMIITGDIPVEMSVKDCISISELLILFLLINSFYIRKTIYVEFNLILLLFPLLLWFISMKQALTYHYHKYDTIVSIIGFSVTLVSLFQLIHRKVKE